MSIRTNYAWNIGHSYNAQNPFNNISENKELEVSEDTINMRTIIAKINANFNAGFPKKNNLKTENTNHALSSVVHSVQEATKEKSSS